MVEAGGDEIPEDTILEALELAHVEIIKICETLEDLRAQVGKPKWVDLELTAELESKHADAIRSGISEVGLREAAHVVEELVEVDAPEVSMSSTEEDMVRRAQVKAAFALIAEKAKLAAVEAPVREQFETELRELTDAEQDSKELKSAKRDLLFDRIIEEVAAAVPDRPRAGGGRGGDEGLGHAPVREAGVRGDLQGPRPQEDRRRQAAPGRAHGGGDPADLVRGHREPAHPRLRDLHARPDADHEPADARHGEGGAEDRRPLPRADAPVHPPLQLPALLGRGDGLHARPEAPGHRPRRARAAGARGVDPVTSRTSRTRSGSSPRRSSRTARRRWARSARRRSR